MYLFPSIKEFKHNDYRTTMLVRKSIKGTILLIHGVACTKEIFFLYPLIFPEYTFIAYDLRGFGTGIAPDGDYHFSKYVDDAIAIASKYKPNLIVGHSFGGAIAQVVSHKLNIPAVVMQTATTPPEKIVEVGYSKFMKAQILEAMRENYFKYLFIPFSIAYLLPLTEYNPTMPAMRHMYELIDFTNLCEYDNVIMKVLGGTRDTVISKEEIEDLAGCSGKTPVFLDVNHAGFMYPDFVYQSLKDVFR